MKILYLLPPSEGKNTHSTLPQPFSKRGEQRESLSFEFKKPKKIAIHATEKDLKCSGKRYEEGVRLNTSLLNPLPSEGKGAAASPLSLQERVRERCITAISRYSGVMYSAINYSGMSSSGKKYFDEHFLILSGMYGIVKPQDMIGNYKLPIETKGLREFWGEKITDRLNTLDVDIIVDLLPGAYKKMINWKKLGAQIVRIDFYKKTLPLEKEVPEGGGIIKLTHGVKKVKGEFVHNLCETGYNRIEDFPGEKVQISENEYHISVIV